MTEPVRTLIVDDEPVARAHLRTLLASRTDVEVVGECGDGGSAVAFIREHAPELVLLDIQMPEIDGLGVVQEIGPDRMPAVIFVTAYDEYALAAFDVHALDYVLKPVNRERLGRALDRVVGLLRSGDGAGGHRDALEEVLAQLRPGRGTERIAIKLEGRVIFVRVDDVDWVEAEDDYVRYHVGKASYLQRDTLARVESVLPASRFLRIHRSTIVNIERIRELQPWFQGDWVVILADGTRLQSGRSYRQRVRALIGGDG